MVDKGIVKLVYCASGQPTGFNSFRYTGNPTVALGAARRVTRPGGEG
jgi:hypothetical protein